MTRAVYLAAFLLVAAPAAAQNPTIDAARAAGSVGEQFDGYVGIAAPVGSSVTKAVGDVNIQRRALYSRLAAEKGVSVRDVGITAGCTLLGRVRVGQAYKLTDGLWRRRGAGDPAPVPDYCG